MIFQIIFVQNDITLYINPLPDEKILDWSKLKQIADEFKVH